ncbi:hypothetical protein GKQ77_18200 [Streptomyces sp. BG9H]|uniref:Gram-positive cocci surface proteins LPxTG domain-containing protein n=1 Tax=Streptomyces anatolicus TaxID=2675858 RepID=A0ABS6YSG4_9ACTN|nr:hypothetical protein [Streptomyces anatolicus]MBW5423476.1 hypothetical protein [Streptomyces anatolicus]
MRVRPTVTAAALTVAAFAMMAPQASAETQAPTAPQTQAGTQPSLSITPSPGKPGQSVVVSVSGGCTAASATATSGAFTQSVPLSTGSAGIYTGTGTIRPDARPGSHTVNVACPGGATSTYAITVAGAAATPTTAPDRGVRAGTGGSRTAEAVYVGAGGALVLIAGGYTVYRMRRRRS